MIEILRGNLGVITAFILIVCLRLWKTFYKYLQRILYSWVVRMHASVLMYPEMAKHHQANSQNILYTKKRLLGVDFFVVQSPYLATELSKHLEYFENSTFIARVFHFGQNLLRASDSKMSSATSSLCNIIGGHENKEQGNENKIRKTTYNTIRTEKPYLQELYPSLMKNLEQENVEFEEPRKKDSACMFDSKNSTIEFNMELLTSKRRQCGQQNQPRHLDFELRDESKTMDNGPEYSGSNTSSSLDETNAKSVLISTKLNDDDIVTDKHVNEKNAKSLFVESFPLIKGCIKELIVLLEAKSNRKDVVNIKHYCYKHCVNILGACVFGKRVNELTNSNCSFYDNIDQLYQLWEYNEKARIGRYVHQTLMKLGMQKKCKKTEKTIEYFKNLIVNFFEGQHDGYQNCVVNSLVKRINEKSNLQREEQIALITAYVIAFSMSVIEVMGGVMALILHELSTNTELQEKIRNNDEIKFDLEGFPRINFEYIAQPLYVDSLIKGTFRKHPTDPVVQLTCKRAYCIPETNSRINPECVVLIPSHVLHTDNNLRLGMDLFNFDIHPEIEKEYRFITDSEIESFFVVVRKFVDMCLKGSLTSLIQVYEFKTEHELNDQRIGSCRFSTLPSELLLRGAKVEKRGKVVIFEESLKTFHASKNVSFLSKIGL